MSDIIVARSLSFDWQDAVIPARPGAKEIQNIRGTLKVVDDQGSSVNFGAASAPTFDTRARIMSMFSTVLGPDISGFFTDYQGGNEFINAGNTSTNSADTSQTGGIAQITIAAGQGFARNGYVYDAAGVTTGAVSPVSLNMRHGAWVIGGRFAVPTMAGLDAVVAGMADPAGAGWVIAGDGSAQYFGLQIKASLSANYLIRCWTGSAQTYIDTGVAVGSVFKEIFVVNDGLGTLWCIADGVVVNSWSTSTINLLPSAGYAFQGTRCASGTAVLCMDYACVLGARL